MPNVIVQDHERAAIEHVDALATMGVATIHEAMGRTGLAGSRLRPNQQGTAIAGTAVTVLSWPGDNLMIHAAVEQCQPGDVLVITTTSESTDGMFGELFATALAQRGVRGVITTAGIRDTEELRQMSFPAWSAHVNAQGTVKATGGSVNVPIILGQVQVHPGDIVVADDDGVVCVPRAKAEETIKLSQARLDKEEQTRQAFRSGELGLDRYNLRAKLEELGVRYVKASACDE